MRTNRQKSKIKVLDMWVIISKVHVVIIDKSKHPQLFGLARTLKKCLFMNNCTLRTLQAVTHATVCIGIRQCHAMYRKPL